MKRSVRAVSFTRHLLLHYHLTQEQLLPPLAGCLTDTPNCSSDHHCRQLPGVKDNSGGVMNLSRVTTGEVSFPSSSSSSMSTYVVAVQPSNGKPPTGSCENRQPFSRHERRKQRRATQTYRISHATRERLRVEAFNVAFLHLRKLLPTLPPDKKLSKIEILRLAICYISYLNHVLFFS